MSIETWAAFAAVSAAVLVIPGPTVIFVVTSAFQRGRAAALPLAGGVALGHATAMGAVALVLGAVAQATPSAQGELRLAGGVYLLWLALRLWRGSGRKAAGEAPARLARRTWTVTALNPITLSFHLAALPQFVDPARAPWEQVPLLMATYVAMGFANALAYALLAARMGVAVGSPGLSRWAGRAAGTMVAGLALGALLR